MKFLGRKADGNPYWVLPSVGNPRVAVPLSGAPVFRSGFEVHNTASVRNRLIKTALRSSYSVLRHDRRRFMYGTPMLGSFMNYLQTLPGLDKAAEAAFYFGTPGNRNRKTVLMLLDKGGNRLGIIKVPVSESSPTYIRREAESIKVLGRLSWKHLIIPQAVMLYPWKDISFSFQSDIFQDTRYAAGEVLRIHITAALELAEHTRQEDGSEYLKSLKSRWGKAEFRDETLRKSLTDAVDRLHSKEIPTVHIHGDFVPYNVRVREGRLHVVDWEFSRRGLPLYDLFHYLFQGGYQIRRRSVKSLVRHIRQNRRLQEYLDFMNISSTVMMDLFRLYLMDFLLFDRECRHEFIIGNHFLCALRILDSSK